MAPASVTSRCADVALPLPSVLSLSATFSAPSALMSVTTTVSPRATRAVAIARPMPDAPPVTIAMLMSAPLD